MLFIARLRDSAFWGLHKENHSKLPAVKCLKAGITA
jgi:hypothetical protein